MAAVRPSSASSTADPFRHVVGTGDLPSISRSAATSIASSACSVFGVCEPTDEGKTWCGTGASLEPSVARVGGEPGVAYVIGGVTDDHLLVLQPGWYHVPAQVLAAAGIPLVYLWVNMGAASVDTLLRPPLLDGWRVIAGSFPPPPDGLSILPR